MIDKVLLDLLFQLAQSVISPYQQEDQQQAEPLWAARNKDGDYYLCVYLGFWNEDDRLNELCHCLYIDIFSKGNSVSVYKKVRIKPGIATNPRDSHFNGFLGSGQHEIIWAA